MHREVVGSSHFDAQHYRDPRHTKRDQPFRDKHQRGNQDLSDQGPYFDQHRRGYRDQTYSEQEYIGQNHENYENEQDLFRNIHYPGEYREQIPMEQYSNKHVRGYREPPLGMAHQNPQSSQAQGSPEVRRHRHDYARNSPKRFVPIC